jgi:glyoxylase-like metal-dependent hydrolase (beta-lactamase superfamily II)
MTLEIETIRARRGQNLSYLIMESGKGLVIDPSSSASEILPLLRRRGIELRTIVNTHGHLDHTEENGLLASRTGARIAIHEADASMLSSPPDFLLRDGQVIELGELKVEVLHTPGHTPGGICLFVGGCVFTGDTLFVGNCGRTDLPGGSDEELFRSLQRLKALPGPTKVYPGHAYWGESSTIEAERSTNPAMMASTLEEFKLVP